MLVRFRSHRVLTLGVVLALGLLAVAAHADDFKDAKNSFNRLFADTTKPSSERAMAVRRLGNFDGEGRNTKSAIDLMFKVFKTPDRGVEQLEAEKAKWESKRQKIWDAVKMRGNTIFTSEQNQLADYDAKIRAIEDKIRAGSIMRNTAVETLGRMTSPDARSAITRGIANRNWRIAAGCIEAARIQSWSGFYDAIAQLYSPKPARDDGVRALAIQALAKINAKRAERIFITALDDKAWLVRMHAVTALGEIQSVKAVDRLIALLEVAQGRLKYDVIRALSRTTGRNFGPTPSQWRSWWSANKNGFVPPKIDAEGPEGPIDPGGDASKKTGEFYGIPVETSRPIFVIDKSGSMQSAADYATFQKQAQDWLRQNPGKNGVPPIPPPPGMKSKWDVVQDELEKVLNQMPKEDSAFNIVWYSTDVNVYNERGMVKAKQKNIDRAVKSIRAMKADGLTNIYEALQKAFSLIQGGARPGGVFTDGGSDPKADTIYFLTDGYPTAGPVKDTAEILRSVKTWNASLRVKIHCIAVGLSETDSGAVFLKQLAQDHGGTFVLRNTDK